MTLEQVHCATDIEMKWADLTIESAILNYDIITSNLTSDHIYESAEYDIIMENAVSDLCKNVLDAIAKVFESIGKMITACMDKISSFLSDSKTDRNIKFINSIKDDKTAKSCKIEIEDVNSKKEDMMQYKKKIEKYRNKFKKGEALTDDEKAELDNANEKCKKKAAIVTVSAVSAATLAISTLLAAKTSAKLKEYNRDKSEYESAMKKVRDRKEEIDSYKVETNKKKSKEKAKPSIPGANFDGKYGPVTVTNNMNVHYKEILQTCNFLLKHESECSHIENQFNLRQGNILNRAASAIARFIGHVTDDSANISKSDIDNLKSKTTDIKNALKAKQDHYMDLLPIARRADEEKKRMEEYRNVRNKYVDV